MWRTDTLQLLPHFKNIISLDIAANFVTIKYSLRVLS